MLDKLKKEIQVLKDSLELLSVTDDDVKDAEKHYASKPKSLIDRLCFWMGLK